MNDSSHHFGRIELARLVEIGHVHYTMGHEQVADPLVHAEEALVPIAQVSHESRHHGRLGSVAFRVLNGLNVPLRVFDCFLAHLAQFG